MTPTASPGLGKEVRGEDVVDQHLGHVARVALGQTRAGRYLRVIYAPDPEPDSVFIITAFDLGPKAKQALRRRRRRKER